ncbi:MAG: hypothetical protein ACHQX3_00175 [Nitrospirales bacterium]
MAEDKKDDKAASATATKERAAAATGAAAVAEAVKKVAEAAVAEVQKTPSAAVEGDLKATGTPGGSLEIVANPGVKFGSSGTATVAGHQVATTEWSVDRIVGKMPSGVIEGEVVVHVDDKTKYTGTLNK